MILALVTPVYPPSVRGNAITVQRIASGLTARGLTLAVFSLDRQDRAAVSAELHRLRPDIVHGFHATATGPLVLEAARALGVPAVITLTGTDANRDLFDPARRPEVLAVLETVQALVVFHAAIREGVCRELPEARPRIHVIAQAVRCQGAPGDDLRARLGLAPAVCLFFQAAGIRRIKNIPAVIPPLTTLHGRHPAVRYVHAGPVIEPEEAARLEAALRDLPWAVSLGAVEHDQVCGLLPSVDVVVNSSLSEGGMSNAVLEAMSQRVPVLASDIEGNRSILTDGQEGFLFGSEAECVEKAERLLTDPALRRAMGERGRRKVAAEFTPERELDGHLALYRSLTGAREG